MVEKQKKKYKIELSTAQVFLAAGIFLFLIIWAFILGIFAGKGFLPEGSFLADEKKDQKTEKAKEPLPEFSFYKKLTEPEQKLECYSVQIAAFTEKKDAQAMVDRLKRYDAYYVKVRINNRFYYRVRCGRFDSKRQAEMLKKRLFKKEHIEGIVVRCK